MCAIFTFFILQEDTITCQVKKRTVRLFSHSSLFLYVILFCCKLVYFRPCYPCITLRRIIFRIHQTVFGAFFQFHFFIRSHFSLFQYLFNVEENQCRCNCHRNKIRNRLCKKNGKYFIRKEMRQDINQRNQQDNLSQTRNKQ